MSNEQDIRDFFKALNDLEAQNEARVTTNQGVATILSPVSFNVYCFSKAEELQLSERDMNRVVSAWACTLAKEPPTYLFKNQNVQNGIIQN